MGRWRDGVQGLSDAGISSHESLVQWGCKSHCDLRIIASHPVTLHLNPSSSNNHNSIKLEPTTPRLEYRPHRRARVVSALNLAMTGKRSPNRKEFRLQPRTASEPALLTKYQANLRRAAAGHQRSLVAIKGVFSNQSVMTFYQERGNFTASWP